MDTWVGAKVRQLRLKASMSEDEAARVCGLELQEYRNSEEGARRFRSRELLALGRELGVSMSNFFALSQ